MEENNKTQADCNCNDTNCCTPKKKSIWPKILLIVIILAAVLIVLWKLYCPLAQNCSKPGCCPEDSTEMVQADTMACCKKATHSCCPSSNQTGETDTVACSKSASHSCCPKKTE